MRRFLIAASLLLSFGSFAFAADLLHYQPGFRLVDGSQLNKMVDVVNGLVGGEVALTGTNPTVVTTTLKTITACSLTIDGSTAPTTTTLSYTKSGATLNIYEWMPTNSSTTTLIASTGTETVGWRCHGTK